MVKQTTSKTVLRLLLLRVPILKYVTKHVIAGSRTRFSVRVKIMALVSNSRLLGFLTGLTGARGTWFWRWGIGIRFYVVVGFSSKGRSNQCSSCQECN